MSVNWATAFEERRQSSNNSIGATIRRKSLASSLVVFKASRLLGYDKLEQKLFAIAHRHDFHDLVEYASEHDLYFPTRQMEEGSTHQFIDEYDNDTFWDELTHRLAERDAINDVGSVDAYFDLAPDEPITRLFRHEERYAGEFNQHAPARPATPRASAYQAIASKTRNPTNAPRSTRRNSCCTAPIACQLIHFPPCIMMLSQNETGLQSLVVAEADGSLLEVKLRR